MHSVAFYCDYCDVKDFRGTLYSTPIIVRVIKLCITNISNSSYSQTIRVLLVNNTFLSMHANWWLCVCFIHRPSDWTTRADSWETALHHRRHVERQLHFTTVQPTVQRHVVLERQMGMIYCCYNNLILIPGWNWNTTHGLITQV